MARGNLVLGVLDHRTLEFLRLPTLVADEMVVVFLFDFVARDAIVESVFGRETSFDEGSALFFL